MRNILLASLLALSTAIAGCSSSGSSAVAKEKTEETQAAYVLRGLLDQWTGARSWVEQTATAPAVFISHLESDKGEPDEGVSTFTVTKAGRCKYQIHIESRTKPLEVTFVHDLTKDLSGVDLDKAPLSKLNSVIATVPGMTGSCTVVTGKPELCSNIGADQLMMYGGVSLVHETGALKAFKAKFC